MQKKGTCHLQNSTWMNRNVVKEGVCLMELMIPERFLEPLEVAAKRIAESLNPNQPEDQSLVQKGLILYRQGLVKNVRFEQSTIKAVVLDVTRVNVELNLDDFSFSTCSCPAEEYCRHQMAVFFHLLSKKNSVSTWLEGWRLPIKEKKTLAELGLKRAKDLIKNEKDAEPDYDRWIQSFDENFENIMLQSSKYPKPYVVPDLFHIYLRRINASSPMKKEWKSLYQLICSIHSFDLLDRFAADCGHDTDDINRYYLHLFQDLMEEAVVMMKRLSAVTVPFAFDSYITKLKDHSANLIHNTSTLVEYERTQLYRRLWTNFFKNKDWREAELEKLNTFDDPSTLPMIVGKAHIHILLHNDDAALAMLPKEDGEFAPYLFYWIDYFNGQKEYTRLEGFIEKLLSNTRHYLETEYYHHKCVEFVKIVLDVITPYCSHMKRSDLYEKALMETLPYSFYYYEEFLFEQAQLEKWTDLQALIGIGLTDIPENRLKVIEKEYPQLLLPLYHQAIQKDIDMKNRDHYRHAVRKMKKLRTLYKKLKQSEQWEQFLEELLEKTKRLRAFQEECKRGKLIHA